MTAKKIDIPGICNEKSTKLCIKSMTKRELIKKNLKNSLP